MAYNPSGGEGAYYNGGQQAPNNNYYQQQQQPQYQQQQQPYGQPPPGGPPQNYNNNNNNNQNYGEKPTFDQTFKIEKPKWNDLWAGILVHIYPTQPRGPGCWSIEYRC